jgi:hypothetical protein
LSSVGLPQGEPSVTTQKKATLMADYAPRPAASQIKSGNTGKGGERHPH